ncbi:MAG: hypothetical protein HY718_21305 [Planctomycetes bacterium]|nr:hypothetical protein [Planctomycetota bacterium]
MVLVPGEAVGRSALRAEVRVVPPPAAVPTTVTVLRALEITFANAATDAAVTELEEDVTIEVSYGGLSLTEAELGRLVIYNATRNELLPTTLDRARQVAVAKTRRFSTFTLALASGPVPRVYLPVALDQAAGGW